MPYNTDLEEHIAEAVAGWRGMEKKKMFGGLCYLVNGNMCFGVWKDFLIVRMAAETAREKLKGKGVRQFDITGKPMKGWVMVDKSAWGKNKELINWLDIGKSHALTLPAKKPRRKSLEEIYYRDRV